MVSLEKTQENNDGAHPLPNAQSEISKEDNRISVDVKVERARSPKHSADSTRWIPLCRSKLKEREMTLCRKRLQKYLEIINQSMDQFTRQNIRFFIEFHGETTIRVQRMDKTNREMTTHFLSDQFIQNMTSSYSAVLNTALQRWNGVLKSKKFDKEDDVEFNVYFKAAKNWMDQRKINMLSDVFWIPLFAVIDQVW